MKEPDHKSAKAFMTDVLLGFRQRRWVHIDSEDSDRVLNVLLCYEDASAKITTLENTITVEVKAKEDAIAAKERAEAEVRRLRNQRMDWEGVDARVEVTRSERRRGDDLAASLAAIESWATGTPLDDPPYMLAREHVRNMLGTTETEAGAMRCPEPATSNWTVAERRGQVLSFAPDNDACTRCGHCGHGIEDHGLAANETEER